MNEEKHISELFDAYLNSELSLDEKAAFERRLDSDSLFKEQFEMHEYANFLIVANETNNIKVEIQELFNDQKGKSLKKNNWIYLALGALALGLLTVLVVEKGFLVVESTSKSTKNKVTLDERDVERSGAIQQTESNTVSPSKLNEGVAEIIVAQEASPNKEHVNSSEVIEPNQKPEVASIPEEKEVIISIDKKEDAVIVVSNERAISKPCMDEIALEVSSKDACLGEADGHVSVEITGGVAPYNLYMNNQSKGSVLKVEAVASGYFNLFALDSEGCSSDTVVDYYVEERRCDEIASSFNPDVKDWEYISDGYCLLVIKNRVGAVVYQEEGSEFRWNGKDQNGRELPIAEYLFLCTKNNEVVEKGFVSIVR